MRFLLLVAILFILVIFETSFFPYLGLAPHLSFIFLLSLSVSRLINKSQFFQVLWLALLTGLLADLQATGWFGFYSLFYLLSVGIYWLVKVRISPKRLVFFGLSMVFLGGLGILETGLEHWGRVGAQLLVDGGFLLLVYPLARAVNRWVWGTKVLQLSFEDRLG